MTLINKRISSLPRWNEEEAKATKNRLTIFRIKDGLQLNSPAPVSIYNLFDEILENADREGEEITLFGLGTSPIPKFCGLIRTANVARVLKTDDGLFVQTEDGTVFSLENCS